MALIDEIAEAKRGVRYVFKSLQSDHPEAFEHRESMASATGQATASGDLTAQVLMAPAAAAAAAAAGDLSTAVQLQGSALCDKHRAAWMARLYKRTYGASERAILDGYERLINRLDPAVIPEFEDIVKSISAEHLRIRGRK